MAERTEYLVVRPQIVGDPDRGFETVYYSDLVRKPSRRAAIRHGINAEGHDDFLLAHLRGDTLVMISWQYEDRPDEDSERDAIAETFGWSTGADAMSDPQATDREALRLTEAEVGTLLSAAFHALGTHAISGHTSELEQRLRGAAERILTTRVEQAITDARAEAWDEGWNASADAAERCDVAGGDWPCGECAICTPPNPYRAALSDLGGDQ